MTFSKLSTFSQVSVMPSGKGTNLFILQIFWADHSVGGTVLGIGRQLRDGSVLFRLLGAFRLVGDVRHVGK